MSNINGDTMVEKVEPYCSIVIRCYNEEQHIGRLLSGIMQQTVKDVEVILVDSGSTDATLSIASQFPINVVHIFPEDFSFGRALNKGCEAALGEFLVFISAHCYPVYNDWLEQLLTPFTDPQVSLVYGKQRGNEITQFYEHQIFASWFPDKSNPRQDQPFCNNANCAVQRDIWERIPYDEELTGLEDLDWAKKAMEMGYHIAYSAEAEIIHVHEETPLRVYNRHRREAIALKQIFPQERFTLWDFIRLSAINISADCNKALKERVLCRNLKSIILFRLMQFSGAYKGFAQRDLVSRKLKQTFYYPNNLKHSINTKIENEREGRIDYSQFEVGDANEKHY
jgi:glycosyltransferase involved in cell wall biosynthesis